VGRLLGAGIERRAPAVTPRPLTPAGRLPASALVALVLVALVLPACTSVISPQPSPPGSQAASASATATAEPSDPSPSATATLPAPGRPYDAATILAAMGASTRPGGVAPQLQTDAIAAAVADRLWTWDGSPWAVMAIGGACGTSTCSIEVAGSRADGPGADAYSLRVDPGTASVEVEAADLQALPPALLPELEVAARTALGDPLAADLALASARWLPPPDAGRYWLAYRTGGEEGTSGLDVLLDLPAGEVLETRVVQ
jgi:hypothetical protein